MQGLRFGVHSNMVMSFVKMVGLGWAIAGLIVSPCVLAQTRPTPRPNSLENTVLSIAGGERLVGEATAAASRQNYELAVSKLQDARQVFNNLSNFYQELFTSFSGVDNRLADGHRQRALQAAQLRDRATYELAIVYRAQNRPELAVPLLVQLIRSQAPTRELGQLAYRQLFELGFVEEAFPRTSSN